MDKDNSGTLTIEELTQGLRTSGYVVSDSDLNRLFKALDTDGTGLVRYHEFVTGAIDSNILLSDSLLRWLFDFMDHDDSNTINTSNLHVRCRSWCWCLCFWCKLGSGCSLSSQSCVDVHACSRC